MADATPLYRIRLSVRDEISDLSAGDKVLVAVSGKIKVTVEMIDGYNKTYQLSRPDIGLYIPKLCWHTMQYSHNAVQMVMASNYYSEKDYIRDYNEFKVFHQKL